MNYISQLLQSSQWKDLILLLLCAICAFKFTIDLYDWACRRFGWENRRQKESVTLTKHEQDISNMEKQLQKIVDKVNVLSTMIVEMQERSDTNGRARIKDRIAQSYRYYHAKKVWTNMEKEAFDDLIRSYEFSGWKNSFIHSICEPESCTWKVVE